MSDNEKPTIKPSPPDGIKSMKRRVIQPIIYLLILAIAAWWIFNNTSIPQQVSMRVCTLVNSKKLGTIIAQSLKCPLNAAWHFALVVPSEPDLAHEKILRAKELIEAEYKDGVDGHPIEIKVYDDAVGNIPEEMKNQAINNANQINQDNQALAVIGHFYSPASQAARPIYEQYEIPVITASSGAPDVTLLHGVPGAPASLWYFRVINDNDAMGGYAGLYASQILGYKTSSIVYVDTSFGRSLRDAFAEAFITQGGVIIDKQPLAQQPELNDAGKSDAEDLVKIFAANAQQPDVIFLAVDTKEAFQFILAMEDAKINYALIDCYDEGDGTFSQWFNEQLKITGRKGHLPDQMYAFTPISYDVAGGASQALYTQYRQKYNGDEPGWLTATTYDALKIAIRAAQETEATGDPNNLASERQKIRAQLAAWNKSNPPSFTSELTRPIYFDVNHNYPAPPMFGYFEAGRFLSAPVQLSRKVNKSTADAIIKTNEQAPTIKFENDFVFKTNVVYTDIHINQITNVDVDKDHQFTADFFMWFIFDPTAVKFDQDANNIGKDIEFTNALAPITLDPPLSRVTLDEHREYQLYRVRSQFRIDSNLAYYPFDEQNLMIEFRSKSLTSDYLIYAQDILGQDVPNNELTNYYRNQNAFENILGDWKPNNINVKIESKADTSSLGNRLLEKADQKVENSTFSFSIAITRNPVRFIVKNLLPLLFLMALTYLALFLPGYKFETVSQLLTGTVLSVVFLHVDLSRRLNVGYIVALDVVFYATYFVLVLELLISIIAWRIDDTRPKTAKTLFRFMRVLYPSYFIVAGGIFLFLFNTPVGKTLLQQNFPGLFK